MFRLRMFKHLLYIGPNDLFKMLVAIYLKYVKVSFQDAINKMVLGRNFFLIGFRHSRIFHLFPLEPFSKTLSITSNSFKLF